MCNYREEKLKDTGITPIFPIWDIPTDKLSREMISGGLRAVITCIDQKQIPNDFVGKEYNESFLNDISEDVDPCGENGEFHSFAFEGPMFNNPVNVTVGNIVHRDSFVFADLFLQDT